MNKRLAIAICAFAALLCCIFAGCTPIARQVSDYTATIYEAQPASATESAIETLARIRPTVVDVTSYAEQGTAAGSGVIISHATVGDTERYFVVTNHHVIEGGESYSVDVLNIADDGSESTSHYDAQLVGSSMKRDIAVLALSADKGTQLTVAQFIKDSDAVKVGTEVLAIGNPLGILGGTVTHGIVSATKRQVSVEEIGTMTLMQTDASINGGNSGGGLFNTDGLLVGIINSGYDTYNGQSVEGLNFAIPANDAKYAASSIIDTYQETEGNVSKFGYVQGDTNLAVTFSSATLYATSSLASRNNYLVAAASAGSPFRSEWGASTKVIVSIAVNGQKVNLTEKGSSSYTVIDVANRAFTDVQAGDQVTVEYKDVMSAGASILGFGRNYVGTQVKTVTVTAEQYVYQPS